VAVHVHSESLAACLKFFTTLLNPSIKGAFTMLVRYALAWVTMVMLAILNGLVRELTYGKRMTELSAHQVATVTGLVVFGAFIFALTRIWRIESFAQALAIGIIWLVLCSAVLWRGIHGKGSSWTTIYLPAACGFYSWFGSPSPPAFFTSRTDKPEAAPPPLRGTISWRPMPPS
jgi:hypothetical protein